MGEVRVRKLDDWVVRFFRTQARQHGTSLEGELRQALTDAARRRKQEIVAQLRTELKQLEERYGQFSDSAPLIREDRGSRG